MGWFYLCMIMIFMIDCFDFPGFETAFESWQLDQSSNSATAT
jgi:hypothetical protein